MLYWLSGYSGGGTDADASRSAAEEELGLLGSMHGILDRAGRYVE
jgi:hypothetical protein